LSFTGFKIGKFIVTDDAIYNIKDAEEVVINFYNNDGLTVKSTTTIGYRELINSLPPRKEFDSLGIMMIPDFIGDLSYIPELTLCKSCREEIGRPVCVIGYQYEHKNLALKTGIISSFQMAHQGLSFIQYDGTVKAGNSGAPLFDAETGKVLGIVMNKELAISKSYRELNKIIDSNLSVYGSLKARCIFMISIRSRF